MVIDAVGADVRSGTGGDGLSVEDVEIPAQFVVPGIVARISQGDAEIQGLLLVDGVYRPHRRIQDLGRVQHDRGIGCGNAVFEAKGEELGRAFLVSDMDCVVSPFGAGCTNMLAWPLYYQQQGLGKAVLGGFDPSARKCMKPGELTFAVPLGLYRKMLAALPESMFNMDGEWKNIRKKIARSAKAWGEEE